MWNSRDLRGEGRNPLAGAREAGAMREKVSAAMAMAGYVEGRSRRRVGGATGGHAATLEAPQDRTGKTNHHSSLLGIIRT